MARKRRTFHEEAIRVEVALPEEKWERSKTNLPSLAC
jgi:hypothetical protein